MEIKRDAYLQQLIDKRNDGMIKVVTGIRRCGKSYLLDPLYKNYLLADGVPADHIIKYEFDRAINRKYHTNADALEKEILAKAKNLSGKRKETAVKLQNEVEEILKKLGMCGTKFGVNYDKETKKHSCVIENS